MVLKNRNKLLLLLMHSVVAAASASYYQKEYSGYLFTISIDYRNQSDAQNWCNQTGSKLLAVTNSSIQNAAVAFINDARQQSQLSANNIITDGMRTNDFWRWINETSSSTTLSIGGQDSNAGYAVSYGYLYRTSGGFTLWAAQPTDTNYYICEFAGQTSCVNGYQYGGQCFQSFNEDVNWFEARNRCLLRGGDLATFEFITTDDGLNSLNGSWINPSTQYWIGLRRQWWTWQSINSDVTYSQWADKEPVYYSNDNVDCLCLGSNDWKWRVCRGIDTAQSVCIRAPSSSASTSASASLRTTNQLPPTSTHSMLQSTLQTTTTSQSSSPTENVSQQDSSNSIKGSSMSVDLGVGLGIGIPALLAIATLVGIVIHLKRKLRRNDSENNVTSESSSAYDSIIYGATRSDINNSAPTFQELNINRPNHSVTSVSSSAYDSIIYGTTRRDFNDSASTYQELDIDGPYETVIP